LPRFLVFVFSFVIVLVFVFTERSAIILVFVFVTKIALLPVCECRAFTSFKLSYPAQRCTYNKVVGDNNVHDADCPTAITNNDRHRTSKLPFLHVNR